MDQLIKPREVAEMLGVPVRTVGVMAAEGRLPHVRLSPHRRRYRRSDIEAYVQRHTVRGVATAEDR